jgi:hypothetical protein
VNKRGARITPSNLKHDTAIRAIPPKTAHVSLSFKYLQDNHAKFSFGNKEAPYFVKLLERLKNVCGLSWQEMRTTHRDPLRCHPHDWNVTTEPRGFGLTGQLADCQGWQFQISSNKYGSVHGFCIDEIFYVVWLDPDHKLYANDA